MISQPFVHLTLRLYDRFYPSNLDQFNPSESLTLSSYMKYPTLLIKVLLLCSIAAQPLFSAEVEQSTQPVRPSQPFTPVALYQGGFHQVIGVEDDEPLINVEGRVVALGKDAAVYFWSNNTFMNPSIETEHQFGPEIGSRVPNNYSRSNQRSRGFEDPIQKAREQRNRKQPSTINIGPSNPDEEYRRDREDQYDDVKFWEQIIPREQPLLDAYGVFIHYGEDGITNLMWREIKYTRKDKKLTLSVPLRSGNRFGNQEDQEDPVYMFLVFQNGEERVPFGNFQREGFLMWNEINSMEKMATAYERSSANQTLDPILIFRPNFVLSEDSHNELKGIVVSVILTVTDTGTVSYADIDSALEPTTAYDLTRSMQSWKFLPAIKDGVRIEEEVEIPLQF